MSIHSIHPRSMWGWAVYDPSRVAVQDSGGQVLLTFGALRDRAAALASWLGGAGVVTGDLVALHETRIDEMLIALFACLAHGLYALPLPRDLSPKDRARLLSAARPRVALGSSSGNQTLPTGAGGATPRALRQTATKLRWRAGQIAFATSGTSGCPRIVVRPLPSETPDVHAALWATRQAEIYGLAIGNGTHLVSTSLARKAPCMAAIRALHLGHTLVSARATSPEGLLQIIDRQRISVLHAVPSVLSAIVSLPTRTREHYSLRSLTHIIHVGARCPAETKRQLLGWLGPLLHEVYGATELGRTYVSSQQWLSRPGTVGRPIEGAQLRVVKDNGQECAPHEVGIVCLGQASERFLYLSDPAATVAAWRFGLPTVEDYGWIDEEGWLFVAGRGDEMITTGGVKVYSAEVEDVLMQEFGVDACAVVGVSHHILGEIVVALVQAPSVTERDLIVRLHRRCHKELPRHKRPLSIVTGTVPLTPAGKVDRGAARSSYLMACASTGTNE